MATESAIELNRQDERGRTRLHYSAMHESPSLLEHLQNGADPNIKDNGGRTPLHLLIICRKGREPIRTYVSAFLSARTKPSAGNLKRAINIARRERLSSIAALIEKQLLNHRRKKRAYSLESRSQPSARDVVASAANVTSIHAARAGNREKAKN